MLKLTLVSLAVLAVLYFVIATRPATMRIARSITIAAPEDIIFAELNDLHRWSRWNPFEKDDTAIRVTHTGAPSGVGASYYYSGGSSGEGRMTITDSQPNERIAVRADFVKPMAATNRIEFTLQPTDQGVDVTWEMTGTCNFVGKAFGLLMNVDKMCGTQFGRGLADLKSISESEARERWETAPVSPSAWLGVRAL
jgi:hypothetical protein